MSLPDWAGSGLLIVFRGKPGRLPPFSFFKIKKALHICYESGTFRIMIALTKPTGSFRSVMGRPSRRVINNTRPRDWQRHVYSYPKSPFLDIEQG